MIMALTTAGMPLLLSDWRYMDYIMYLQFMRQYRESEWRPLRRNPSKISKQQTGNQSVEFQRENNRSCI